MSAAPARIPESLLPLAVPIDDLTGYHRNPRTGDVAAIAESLRVNGQYKAIVVNRGTHTGRPNEILAGNHTWAAAKQLGWEQIAATFVDVSDEDAARIVVVDNRTSDLAGYDSELLAVEPAANKAKPAGDVDEDDEDQDDEYSDEDEEDEDA
ncbi:ParB/RepB/Spo0J family partition protein [Streptomyces sp. NPDC001984]|uniref:ParB/RepB/Spo0J family partition protein n=1 Tax=Streptomyces sp. NPDC002619 TaxID=3364655 RepID=UPI0036BCFF2A